MNFHLFWGTILSCHGPDLDPDPLTQSNPDPIQIQIQSESETKHNKKTQNSSALYSKMILRYSEAAAREVILLQVGG
jgi:hypothetical protein